MIFAKNLVHGKVKTRLAATVGHDRALAVYTKLLEHTAAVTVHLPVDKFVFYSDYIDHKDCWDENSFQKRIQNGSDLGDKMCDAFAYAFNEGYNKVIIIGTDCMELETAIITNAFESLNRYDAVIGPAKDGGYYLLGIKKLHAAIFENIEWSTNAVFEKTIAIFKQLNLTYCCLKKLSDVDVEKDLQHTNLVKQ